MAEADVHDLFDAPEQTPISRRKLLTGAAAAGLSVAAGSTFLRRLRDASTQIDFLSWPPATTDIVFLQEWLFSDQAVDLSGCRRSAHATAGYLSASVPKATTALNPTRLHFPGSDGALIAPIAGLVPRDEYTITLDILNNSGVDFPSAPFPSAQVLLVVSGTMLWRYSANGIALTNFNSGQGVTFTIAPGSWPAGSWQSWTIWWRRSDSTMWLMRGTDFAGRQIAGAPTQTQPPASWPLNGSDDGFQVGGGAAATHPFEVKSLWVHRYFWPYTTDPLNTPPKLTVNASTNLGAWKDGRSGVLGLWEGFEQLNDPYPSIRSQQFDLVFNQAGSKLVRFAGPMQYITPVETPPGSGQFTYNWANLDAKIDSLLVGRPNLKLHLGLDYCPSNLRAVGASIYSVPNNFTKWAQIASDIVGHVKTRYGSQFSSTTIWNEPDLSNYWLGTQQQMYDLWKTTQNKLIATHPDKKLGTPEFAYQAGLQGFFTWLGTQTTTLKQSITGIYLHDFQQNLQLVRKHLADARSSATAAGVPTTVPLRITEYNLFLGQLTERHTDPNSWYTTQPIHFLWEALEEQPNIDMACFAAIGCNILFWGEQAIVSCADPVQPYGPWSTIALLGKLSGNRITADSNWPTTRALATKSATGVITVAYANFKPYRGFYEDSTFDIAWSGLPTTYTWTHWQLDYNTSSGGKYAVVASGNQTNLPAQVVMGNLGVGGIQITP
jgi:hypothetical protein